MSVELKVEGFREIEKALLDLPRGTAMGVVRRAMKKELKPVQDMANAMWPGADDGVFVVTSRIRASQRGDTLAKAGKSVVNMFVGGDGRYAPHAHLIEFGTGPRSHLNGKYVGQVAPQPMLQPAWDANKDAILRGLAEALWREIAATQARRARKAAR